MPNKDPKEMHPMVAPSKPFEGSGKEVADINPPIVSVEPVNADDANKPTKPEPETFKIFDKVSDKLFTKEFEGAYPLDKLELGQGLFIEPKEGETVDKLLMRLRKLVFQSREMFGVRETNQDGDEMREHITVDVKKRNDDGTVQLSNGVPIIGANFTQLHKYKNFRDFVVTSVMKDAEITEGDKAPANGALIIRVI